MATETSTFHDFLNALADGLAQHPTLASVQIATAPLGQETAKAESIQFGALDMEQSWGMLGNRRREEQYTVNGVVWVFRPGKNEPVIRDVRGRTRELLAAIEDFLRVDPTVGNVVKVCQLTNGRLEQGANSDGRWCQFDFDIVVNHSLSSS